MMTQLDHPDSGIQADTLLTFFLNQLVNTVNTWMDIDKGLTEDRQGRKTQLFQINSKIFGYCFIFKTYIYPV